MFRITQRGSYYLTGNVSNTGDKNGILIEADDVTIDLMGFVMAGGLFNTVAILGTTPLRNITIRNGYIRNWRDGGINLGPASEDMCRFENLTIRRCFSDALISLTAAQVVDCQAFINDGHGFRLGANSTVTRCVARQNTGNGFNLGAACTAIECSAILSGLGGFDISFGSLVRACLARSNLREGIIAGGGSTVEACNATLNASHGIRIAGDGTVRRNDCAANGQTNLEAGIFCSGSDARIESNNCTNNGIGIRVAQGGNIILGNTCSGNIGDNYVIAAGNRYGPIVNLTAQTAPAVAGSTAADTTGTSHPWANFAY
jgi:parallel beta-helix repeat protein